ncbi:polysaccharide deacetylase family protein [Siminovitchia sp. 179-K 8D1 HS]|uniref:polysaccharide deacetylase family protein n=1 Tax=Siminovitchia sp. 179-K 8D1 HS TaxID=3142385 RepID=UPI00399FCE14
MKRIKLPGWITITIMIAILLIAGGIHKLAGASKIKAQEEIQKEKIISRYPKINLKTVTKQTDQYTYSINHPETDSEKINRYIDEWIKEKKEAFLKAVKHYGENLPKGEPAHLNIQMETNRITEDFYSLVFRTSQMTGGAKGEDAVKIFNIDMKEERFLEIGDVLELNKKSLEDIRKIVLKELRQNEEIQPFVPGEKLNRLMQSPEDWEWSIDRKTFSLYINGYEIASKAAGAVEIDIPIEKMYIFLKKDVDSFLKMPKEQKLEKDNMIRQEQMKLNPDGKYVALTFDDGPSATVTPRVLKTLKEHNAKATFFMLGNQVDYYPNLARKVAEEGHEIGNHSKSHPDLSKMRPGKMKEEMNYTKEKIKEATGIAVNLIRPPYGAYNDDLKDYAKANGDSIILWSVDSTDWKIRNARSVKKMVQSAVSPGGIVLMHDIHPSTADALPELLTALENEGYQFVTVSELLGLKQEKGIGPFFGS